jgi:hypothetical protein
MTEQTSTIRGARFRQMREALGLSQGEMAAKLNSVSATLGLDLDYDAHDISVRETGRVGLKVEDYAVASFIDPQRWSWMWLPFGRELVQAKRGTKVADAIVRKHG